MSEREPAAPLDGPAFGSYKPAWDYDSVLDGPNHREAKPMTAPPLPHDHGCPVEQIHRVWTTDQGVSPWVLAEETLRFVQASPDRRCTCSQPKASP